MSDTLTIADTLIEPGETKDVWLPISQSYTGDTIHVPLRVVRAKDAGPVLLLCGAVHGDEINGTGIIRELVFDRPPAIVRGTMICVPVINIFGFEAQQRYLPDGRDLNRSFPGNAYGSLASRFAHTLFEQLITRCDYCLDFHSAGATRTNYPNIRGDLTNPDVRNLAKAFGCELIVNGKGPKGSLRRTATDKGCPTIILEAGEVHKIEPGVLRVGLRGIRNVLIHLNMLGGEIKRPAFQTRVKKSTWLRASLGGLLRFHVSPGELVEHGQPIATTESVFGEAQSVVLAPSDAIVLGMTTHPAVHPGEPICHLAITSRSLRGIRKAIDQASKRSALAQVRDDLATSFSISPTDWKAGAEV